MIKKTLKNSWFLVVLFALTLVCRSESSQAQTVLDPEISGRKLTHSGLRPTDFPAPGLALKLIVHSYDTLDLKLKVRAVIVRDGELIDIFLPPARVGNNEKPEYTALIAAPETSLSYQFFRYNKDGSVTKTEQFQVSRDCRPRGEYQRQDYDIKTKDPREKILNTSKQANALEVQVSLIDFIVSLADEIKQITEE